MIDTGEVKNQSDLASKLGVSRVRISQVLSLLKLDNELIRAIEKLGDPVTSRTVTERMLRGCLNSPELYKSVQSRLSKFLK
jgi:hypothetical protein